MKKTLFKRVIVMQIFGATQLEADLLTAWSNDLFIPTYRRGCKISFIIERFLHLLCTTFLIFLWYAKKQPPEVFYLKRCS